MRSIVRAPRACAPDDPTQRASSLYVRSRVCVCQARENAAAGVQNDDNGDDADNDRLHDSRSRRRRRRRPLWHEMCVLLLLLASGEWLVLVHESRCC